MPNWLKLIRIKLCWGLYTFKHNLFNVTCSANSPDHSQAGAGCGRQQQIYGMQQQRAAHPIKSPFISQLFTNILHLSLWNAAQRNPDSPSLVFPLSTLRTKFIRTEILQGPAVSSWPVIDPSCEISCNLHTERFESFSGSDKPSLAQNSDGSPQS